MSPQLALTLAVLALTLHSATPINIIDKLKDLKDSLLDKVCE